MHAAAVGAVVIDGTTRLVDGVAVIAVIVGFEVDNF